MLTVSELLAAMHLREGLGLDPLDRRDDEARVQEIKKGTKVMDDHDKITAAEKLLAEAIRFFPTMTGVDEARKALEMLVERARASAIRCYEWEYHTTRTSLREQEGVLDKMGRKGWQLAAALMSDSTFPAVGEVTFYFKREVRVAASEASPGSERRR